ncbi:abc transporter h family member 2 [Anaeramoeba ignava]|uniref:Abc transporter h family member 2 n=1 Tax=Anaeramoeba ignava TaxID=1746090 RepID=A0A9Q0REG0_ANAIG|nr:abc transporter h family member 2 [Anaeramoeba ignava]
MDFQEISEDNNEEQNQNNPPWLKIIRKDKTFGNPVIILRNISKDYDLGGEGQVHALVDINISSNSEYYPVLEGELLMLRGPSGCGKTTLLNIMGTFDKATSGIVEIMGTRIDTKASDKFLANLRLEKVGFVFQTFNLLATLSAFENVELPMLIQNKLSKKKRRARTKKLLTRVGLGDRMDHLPSELSGGEKQRVAIARALSNKPNLLLLDEVTADLSTKGTIHIMNLLLDLNLKKKVTMVLVTHNPDLEVYADRILYFRDGKIERQVINTQQTALNFKEYMAFLRETENQMVKENDNEKNDKEKINLSQTSDSFNDELSDQESPNEVSFDDDDFSSEHNFPNQKKKKNKIRNRNKNKNNNNNNNNN